MFHTKTFLRRLIQQNNIKQTQKCYASSAAVLAATKQQETMVYPADWDAAKPYESVPGPTPLPIVGDAWRFFGGIDFIQITDQMRKKYGNVVRLQKLMSFGEMVFVMDVKDMEWMLRNEGPWPNRLNLESMMYYRHTTRRDIYGDTYGLMNGQNEDWGSFRTIVNPIMMQPRTTHQYIPLINDISDEMIEHVRKLKAAGVDGEMPATFIDELNKWTFESITAIALDTRLGCLSENPSERARKVMEYIIETMKLAVTLDLLPFGEWHRRFNTKPWRRFVICQDYFTNMTVELIEEANKRIQADPHYADKPEHEKSVFEKLVAIDRQIAIVMILDMLSAGVETTARVTGAILYFLAKNKDAQRKLREELRLLMPKKNSPLTKQALDDAKYLRACIKEALRIAPIGFANMRTTTKPMVIGGYQVPPGIIVTMPHLYVAMHMDHFTDPEKYIPDRWLRGGEEANKVNPFATLPFGFGARSCIGKRMANMEIEVLIAKMVRNFNLDWKHKDMTFKQTLLYGISDPLKISLTDLQE